jgi:ABC-type enterobactin transport system permease subunit
MGLRRFHLLFIALSVALAAFVAAWAGGQYRGQHEIRFVVTSIVALLSGGALAVYGAKFQRRTRNLQ